MRNGCDAIRRDTNSPWNKIRRGANQKDQQNIKQGSSQEVTNMAQKKQLPRKHSAKKTTEQQEEIIRRIQTKMRQEDGSTSAWLVAKNEYFENQEKYDKGISEAKKKDPADIIAAQVEPELKKEKEERKRKTATMTISETKLGITMVLSKKDCKDIGFTGKEMTREAIKKIRTKLGLPEKTQRD